ncbi:MAG TPA: hypothetical protein VGB42_09375 [Candidatus Thermoplasmatota archaeon]
MANALGPQAHDLRRDERGSIEGLPLYFLVSALVVAVATSALLSMMGGLQGQTMGAVVVTPDTVSVAGGAGSITFTVTVTDTDGNPIEGAVVSANGMGVSAASKTDASGKVRFTVDVDMGSGAYGEIDVEATHHGPAGEGQRSASLLVTRG